MMASLTSECRMKVGWLAIIAFACMFFFPFGCQGKGSSGAGGSTSYDKDDKGLLWIMVDGKYGFIDANGTVVIKPQYTMYCYFTEGLAIVHTGEFSDLKVRIIDQSGKTVIDPAVAGPKFIGAGNFHEGLACVVFADKNENHISHSAKLKYGFINTDGKLVIQANYDQAEDFSEGLAAIKLSDKWGFINKNGRVVVKPKYDSLRDFSDGLAAVRLEGLWGYIDKQGNTVIAHKYSAARPFENGKAEVGVGGRKPQAGNYLIGEKYGLINKKGEFVIKPLYDLIGSKNSDGQLAVSLDGNWGLVDKTGKTVIAHKYSRAYPATEGLISVVIGGHPGSGGKFGFIDEKGNYVIEPKYERAHPFHEGLAAVKLNGKWGFIDKSDKVVISFQYTFAFSFSKGIAPVTVESNGLTPFGGKQGYIDTSGNWIWKPTR